MPRHTREGYSWRKRAVADARKQGKPLGNPSDFEEAFPGLEDAIIEYRAARPGGAFQTDRPLPTTRISLKVRGPIMHCLNPNCRNGGYDVSRLVREMLGAGDLEREGRVTCAGKEAEAGRPWEECNECLWSWDFRLTLVPR
jgi:hypothetical protein